MATLRNSQDIIKGSHLMVLMDVSGTLTPIAFATSHTFSKSLNTQEINCKDFGDVAAVIPQNYTWSMQTDNLYSINGYKLLNDAFKNMEKVTVYFGETTYDQVQAQSSIVDVDPAPADWSKAGFGEQGYAFITSLDVTASAGENATFSATFQGTGTLEEITTTVSHSITMAGNSTIVSNLTLSTASASAGTRVAIVPSSVDYYNNNITVTTTPSTNINWQESSTEWYFTMPDTNVTVNAAYIQKYGVTKGGSMTSEFTIEPTSYVAASSYVYITPIDSTRINDTSYIGYTEPSLPCIWVTSYNGWRFEMPAYDVTAYIGPR